MVGKSRYPEFDLQDEFRHLGFSRATPSSDLVAGLGTRNDLHKREGGFRNTHARRAASPSWTGPCGLGHRSILPISSTKDPAGGLRWMDSHRGVKEREAFP